MKLFHLLFTLTVLFFLVVLFSAEPVSAAVPAGNYLELNGGYVKTTTPPDSFSYTFDFSVLVNPNSVTGKQIIFSVGDKSSQSPHYEVGINGGLLYADYYYDAYARRYVATGNIKAGEWSSIKVYLKNHLEELYLNNNKIFSYSHEQPYNIKDLGPDIVLGSSYLEPFSQANNFKGKIDSAVLNHEVYSPNSGSLFTQFIDWPLDEVRGETVARDISGNGFNGTLVGGDGAIHFYGVLPTPTPWSYALPTISWRIPVLPTLSFPFPNSHIPNNTAPPAPNPVSGSDMRNFPRPTRSFSR